MKQCSPANRWLRPLPLGRWGSRGRSDRPPAGQRSAEDKARACVWWAAANRHRYRARVSHDVSFLAFGRRKGLDCWLPIPGLLTHRVKHMNVWQLLGDRFGSSNVGNVGGSRRASAVSGNGSYPYVGAPNRSDSKRPPGRLSAVSITTYLQRPFGPLENGHGTHPMRTQLRCSPSLERWTDGRSQEATQAERRVGDPLFSRARGEAA